MTTLIKLACNLPTPYCSSQRRQSLCVEGLAVCRYNNRLQRFHDGLTWCFVAGNLLKLVHDTREGSPQWRSGESHWMSAHPWVTAGHWPWLPSNQPLSEGKGDPAFENLSPGFGPKPASRIQGSSQNTLLQCGYINSHAVLASGLPKITSIHWLVIYLGFNSVFCRFLCCHRG